MEKKYIHSKIVENQRISKNLYTLKLKAPDIARTIKVGQFINIYFQNDVKIFPRPFSISEVKEDLLFLRYKIIGSQTRKMSTWKKGYEIRILGPLGNSFDISENVKSHILVGGGIGVAPLFYLRDQLYQKGGKIHFFVGATTQKEHYFTEDDKSNLYLATDDGTLGFDGTVVALLKEHYPELSKPAVIYCCGPEPMLEALKSFGHRHDIEVQVSMEKIMACGNGLCQGCAIRTEDHMDRDYLLVCKDGPIFNARDIIIDD